MLVKAKALAVALVMPGATKPGIVPMGWVVEMAAVKALDCDTMPVVPVAVDPRDDVSARNWPGARA